MARGAVLVVVVVLFACGSAWLARALFIGGKIAALRDPVPSARAHAGCNGPATAPRIIMIGDSRLSRWPAELLASSVSNRGVAGETVSQMLLRFPGDVLDCRPQAVLIASGINDLVAASFLDRAEGERVAAQVAASLIAAAEDASRGGADVYVATIVPPGRPDLLRRLVWSWSVVDYVRQANRALRSHPLHGSVHLLDLAASVASDDEALLPDLYRHDTLHLNAAGYRRLTASLPRAFAGSARDAAGPT